ncbi:hypothetical protein, partial [Xanthomonas hortorum]|uniref:hypothetical protein n=1 Tax=Xanthomonas hortorum TaxID=56454 RepID=UPI0019D382AF
VQRCPNALSENHISGAVKRAKATPNPPTWGNTNDSLRNEVTWGDTDVLATIIPRMEVPRHGQLVAAFSQAHSSSKAMQIIRNASAHNNRQTMEEVVALSSRYIAFEISHPTHALFWIDPSSGDYLFRHALEDLRENGSFAIT